MTRVLEVELETKRPRRRGRTTAAAVFGAVLAVPVAASGAEAYVPDEGGSSSPNELTSADAAERRAEPEPAPATPPTAAPEPAPAPEPRADDVKPAEHQALRDVEPAPEPSPEPSPAREDVKPNEHQALRDLNREPEPAPKDVKPNEHEGLRDLDTEPAPRPAPEDIKRSEHQALRDLNREPEPAPEEVKPNEHEGLRDVEPSREASPESDPAPEDVKPFEHQALRDVATPPVEDDGPRGDGDGPLPPYGGLDPQVWVHLPEEDRQAIREQQQREEDERQLEEWAQNPPDYVALGDSYAAGTGTIPDDEDPAGQRTEDAYAPEIAESRNYDLQHVAYGGATTENVLEGQDEEGPQVDALSASTDVVTISIGGNDANFGDVVTACADPRNDDQDCFDSVDEARAIIEDELPGRLDQVYSEVSTRAPEAEVVVVGYPRLWNSDTDDDSNDLVGFTPDEIDELNETGDILAVTIGEQARAYDFEYVDPRATFDGHGVGSDEEYLNGASTDWGRILDGEMPVDDDSFHPNEAGYDALGAEIVAELED